MDWIEAKALGDAKYVLDLLWGQLTQDTKRVNALPESVRYLNEVHISDKDVQGFGLTVRLPDPKRQPQASIRFEIPFHPPVGEPVRFTFGNGLRGVIRARWEEPGWGEEVPELPEPQWSLQFDEQPEEAEEWVSLAELSQQILEPLCFR